MNLIDSKENNFYYILEIEEGLGVKHKLISMGIFSGVKIKVIKNDKKGPLVIAIKASRVSIGRGLASKIKIENERNKHSSYRNS